VALFLWDDENAKLRALAVETKRVEADIADFAAVILDYKEPLKSWADAAPPSRLLLWGDRLVLTEPFIKLGPIALNPEPFHLFGRLDWDQCHASIALAAFMWRICPAIEANSSKVMELDTSQPGCSREKTTWFSVAQAP